MVFPPFDASWEGGIRFLGWILSLQRLNQVVLNLFAYFKNCYGQSPAGNGHPKAVCDICLLSW